MSCLNLAIVAELCFKTTNFGFFQSEHSHWCWLHVLSEWCLCCAWFFVKSLGQPRMHLTGANHCSVLPKLATCLHHLTLKLCPWFKWQAADQSVQDVRHEASMSHKLAKMDATRCCSCQQPFQIPHRIPDAVQSPMGVIASSDSELVCAGVDMLVCSCIWCSLVSKCQITSPNPKCPFYLQSCKHSTTSSDSPIIMPNHCSHSTVRSWWFRFGSRWTDLPSTGKSYVLFVPVRTDLLSTGKFYVFFVPVRTDLLSTTNSTCRWVPVRTNLLSTGNYVEPVLHRKKDPNIDFV